MTCPHAMKKPASSSLFAGLYCRKSNASVLHDGRLSCDAEVVNLILVTYATYDAIAIAVKYLEFYKQASSMTPTEFAKKMYTKALRCGPVYEEMRLKLLFVHGLGDAVYDSVRLYRSQNLSEPLTLLVRYADNVTKIADNRSTASCSTNRSNRDPSSNCIRNTRGNQSFTVSGETEILVQSVAYCSEKIPTNLTPSSDVETYCRKCLV